MRRKYFLLLASEKLSIKKLNFLVFLRNLAQKIKIFVQKKNARMDIFFEIFWTLKHYSRIVEWMYLYDASIAERIPTIMAAKSSAGKKNSDKFL
mgnify:CR=1 FL=1